MKDGMLFVNMSPMKITFEGERVEPGVPLLIKPFDKNGYNDLWIGENIMLRIVENDSEYLYGLEGFRLDLSDLPFFSYPSRNTNGKISSVDKITCGKASKSSFYFSFSLDELFCSSSLS
jgi:hypothetical protein